MKSTVATVALTEAVVATMAEDNEVVATAGEVAKAAAKSSDNGGSRQQSTNKLQIAVETLVMASAETEAAATAAETVFVKAAEAAEIVAVVATAASTLAATMPAETERHRWPALVGSRVEDGDGEGSNGGGSDIG